MRTQTPLSGQRQSYGVHAAPLDVPGPLSQVLLDERRTQVNIQLHEWLLANAREGMDLARLDDEDVAGAGLERLAIHGPPSAARLDELDLVVGMPVRTRTAARLPIEEIHADARAMVGAHEAVRAAGVRQVLLAESEHVSVGMRGEDSRLPPIPSSNAAGLRMVRYQVEP
jgi:hypothetical protein